MKNKKNVTLFDEKARLCAHNTMALELKYTGSNWAWQSRQNSLADIRQNTLALQTQLSNLLQSVQVKECL